MDAKQFNKAMKLIDGKSVDILIELSKSDLERAEKSIIQDELDCGIDSDDYEDLPEYDLKDKEDRIDLAKEMWDGEGSYSDRYCESKYFIGDTFYLKTSDKLRSRITENGGVFTFRTNIDSSYIDIVNELSELEDETISFIENVKEINCIDTANEVVKYTCKDGSKKTIELTEFDC